MLKDPNDIYYSFISGSNLIRDLEIFDINNISDKHIMRDIELVGWSHVSYIANINNVRGSSKYIINLNPKYIKVGYEENVYNYYRNLILLQIRNDKINEII